MPATSPIEPSAGRRFELVRTLGVGSFGTVYLAEMESAGGFRRRVALKILNPSWDQVSDASTRLRDEARLLGRLQHRHIVRVDDLLRLDGRWALLMEFIDGVDLECVVSPPPDSTIPAISPKASLEIVAAAASALRAANETLGIDDRPLAVVHRDIKPSNIRVTAAGDIKVLDFGVARADFVGREAKTERVRYGSLGYMSPERLLGGDETPAGDVYALGVVLYELILRSTYGRSELGPEAQDVQVERAVVALTPIAGEDIAKLVGRMLAYGPEDRPSAQVVENEARALLASRTEGDLAAWCSHAVPALDRAAATDDGAVRGRVLAESDVSGRAIVNSATMVLPADEPPPPNPTSRTNDTMALAQPEPPANVGGPLKMAWIVGGLTAAGLLAGVGWAFFHPTDVATPAPIPVAAIAPAPATAVPVIAPVPATPVEPIVVPATENPAVVAAVSSKPVAAKPASSDAPIAVVAPPPSPPAAPVADAVERLRSAKFVLANSTERLDVVCGDVRNGGSGNALIQSFPPGVCSVTAGGVSTTVNVQEPRKVDCTLESGTLSCR